MCCGKTTIAIVCVMVWCRKHFIFLHFHLSRSFRGEGDNVCFRYIMFMMYPFIMYRGIVTRDIAFISVMYYLLWPWYRSEWASENSWIQKASTRHVYRGIRKVFYVLVRCVDQALHIPYLAEEKWSCNHLSHDTKRPIKPSKIGKFWMQAIIIHSNIFAKFGASSCIMWNTQRRYQRHNRRSIRTVHKLSRMLFSTSKWTRFVVAIEMKHKKLSSNIFFFWGDGRSVFRFVHKLSRMSRLLATSKSTRLQVPKDVKQKYHVTKTFFFLATAFAYSVRFLCHRGSKSRFVHDV